MQRNFMNYNEVFPILDLIGRVQNRKRGNVNFHDTGGNESDGSVSFSLPVDLRVVKLDVVRDDNNIAMPGVIIRLLIEYENGAKAELDIHRGLEPNVSPSVDDADFINNVMITGLTMVTQYMGSTETMELVILKENGYGTLLGIEVKWDGRLEEVITVGEDEPNVYDFEETEDEEFEPEELDEPDYDDTYDNPDDFFNNGANQERDIVIGFDEEITEE